MGKGSQRRPQVVDAQTFARNWERAFAPEAKEPVPDEWRWAKAWEDYRRTKVDGYTPQEE